MSKPIHTLTATDALAFERTHSFGDEDAMNAARRQTARIGERYRLIRMIGEGGMGVVYEGEDLALRRPVAIKLLSNTEPGEAAKRRFRRELECQSRLFHPNVVPAFDGGECPQVGLYIVMPLVADQTLRRRLSEHRVLGERPTVRAVVGVAHALAGALKYVHVMGVTHRDLKPSNVLVGECVRLFDFGVSRRTDEAERLTATGGVLGTWSYMSPEQARGEEVDHRTDLHALGVVCWEMLTGCTPVGCAATRPPLPPVSAYREGVPASFSDLVERLTNPNARYRPGSATEVADQLDRIVCELPTLLT